MYFKLIKWLLTGMFGLMAACAIITVNVYFPEKAVKDAYKSLDDMLLKNGGEKPPVTDKQPDSQPATSDSIPQSRLFDRLPSISFAGIAQAAENVGDELAIELAGMPEVVKAYNEMNKRLPRLNVLFGNASVGLNSQGLVSVRDKSKLNAQDEGLIAQENQSRKTVIVSMAKAILKINKVKETKPALDQVMGKAATTFAETRRDAAWPGWWIQLPNSRWLQK